MQENSQLSADSVRGVATPKRLVRAEDGDELARSRAGLVVNKLPGYVGVILSLGTEIVKVHLQ